MPTYEFACTACEHRFDQMNSITNRNEPLMYPCPNCGELKVERRIGTPPQVCPDAINLGRKPVDGGFQEVLAKIHQQTPGSNLNQHMSRNPNAWS